MAPPVELKTTWVPWRRGASRTRIVPSPLTPASQPRRSTETATARRAARRGQRGRALGERAGELVLDGPAMTPWAEAALFATARAELAATVIRPALAGGADVVCDRYIDSSLAYQGLARGLGIERVLQLN